MTVAAPKPSITYTFTNGFVPQYGYPAPAPVQYAASASVPYATPVEYAAPVAYSSAYEYMSSPYRLSSPYAAYYV